MLDVQQGNVMATCEGVVEEELSCSDVGEHTAAQEEYVSLHEPIPCGGCGLQVCDRFFLLAAGRAWHNSCLRCSQCQCQLQTQPTLYYRDGHIYCHHDYSRLFCGRQCARCFQPILGSELVMWSAELSFHPHCFSCQECEVKLPGNLYYMQGVNTAFAEGEESVSSSELRLDQRPDGGRVRSRSKRIRTCFGNEQLRALESYFSQEQNPNGKDWNNLVHQTNLPKKVLQVWFRNARAKLRRSDDSPKALTMTTASASPLRTVTAATASPPPPSLVPLDRPLVFPTIDQWQLLQLTSADQWQQLLPSPDSQVAPGCVSYLEEFGDFGDFIEHL